MEKKKEKIDVIEYYTSDRTIKAIEDIRNEAANGKRGCNCDTHFDLRKKLQVYQIRTIDKVTHNIIEVI